MGPTNRSELPDLTCLFEEYTLANGMHVILHEDHHLPIVAINVWYHVGSKNEREGKTGFAHLFEHMMFQGSAHVPANGHFAHVQGAGGTLNASTTFDRTNYYDTLPAHQVELGLWLESDRMMSLAVTEQNLETQRNVVMEERRTRYDNQPYGTMILDLFERAFKVQPYRWPIIGSMDDIRNARLEEVQAFHAMYYQPRNASLCVAGDIRPEEVRILIDRYFGSIPNTDQDLYRPVLREPVQRVEVRDFVYDAVPLPAIAVGFHMPELTSRAALELSVLSTILGSGESSRLHKRLVYETRLAQSVMTYAYGLELPGLFIARLAAQQGVEVEELEARFWECLKELREQGVSEEEMRKAHNRQTASFAMALASLDSRADMLNFFHVMHGRTARMNEETALIRSVTAADLTEAARTWLQPSNATVLFTLPHAEGRES